MNDTAISFIQSHKKKLMVFLGIPIGFYIFGVGFILILFFGGIIYDLISTLLKIEPTIEKGKTPRAPLILFIWSFAITPLGLVHFFGGGYTLIKQIFPFLLDGIWQPISAIDMILLDPSDTEVYSWGNLAIIREWATEPETFIGIHKIFQSLNGGIVYLVLGLAGSFLGIAPTQSWYDKMKEKLKST